MNSMKRMVVKMRRRVNSFCQFNHQTQSMYFLNELIKNKVKQRASEFVILDEKFQQHHYYTDNYIHLFNLKCPEKCCLVSTYQNFTHLGSFKESEPFLIT